jgi:hypothetical protein
MILNNDGGWCWDDLTVTYQYPANGSHFPMTSHYVNVVDQPEHGHIIIQDLANYRIRIAYQPQAGFAGKDKFTVHYQVRETNVGYFVTVSD